MPAITRSKVVFPAPLRPISATRSPCAISAVTSCSPRTTTWLAPSVPMRPLLPAAISRVRIERLPAL